jgi:hypothetical protein
MKILISTIIRNREKVINTWYTQLQKLIQNSKHEFYLSVYENDSNDASRIILNNLSFDFFKDKRILCEDINTTFYSSVNNMDRVKNLSEARNKTLDVNYLNICDKIIVIEPDIIYNIEEMTNLIEESQGLDIISPKSIHAKYPNEIYDKWAIRFDSEKTGLNEEDWNPEKFSGKMKVWSTFNCFCIYNSEPIKNNIKFGYINPRTKQYDCDTAVICENFIMNKYNKIYMDFDKKVLHT